MNNLSKNQGMLLVFLSGICWGFSGACAEYITRVRNFNIDILIPYRLLISGFCLLIFYKIRYKKIDFSIFKHKYHLIRLLIYSFLGIFVAQYFYFYGVSLSNAAVATVIQFISPIFIILIVCIEEKRFPKITEVLAFSLVFIGAFLLSTNANFEKLLITPKALIICLLGMLGAVANAIIPRKISKIYSPILVLAYALIVSGVFSFIYNKVWQKTFDMDFMLLMAIFWVIFIGTIIALAFYIVGLNIIGAAKTTIISSSTPIIAAICSYFWLGTSLFIFQIIGFILIIFAILLSSFKD